jgi:hypothetical protein
MRFLELCLVTVVLVFSFTSCTSQATEGSQYVTKETVKENPTATLMPYQTPSQEPTLISSTSLLNRPDVTKLGPGTYLMYTKTEGPTVKIYTVKLGEVNETYLFTPTGYFDVSSNGKFIAYTNNETDTLDIMSVESSDILSLPLPSDTKCVDISVSADGAMVACGGDEIYVIFTGENKWHQLTYWSENKPNDTWDIPRYSPNGKWLSYFNLADMSFSKNDGVYLTNMTCLNQIESCRKNTMGPVFNEVAGIPGNGNFSSWSPDSKKLVLPGHNKLYVFDVKTGTSNELYVDIQPDAVSWSPTGDVIAFSGYDVYLVSPDGNNQERIIDDAWLLGWLVMSWKFTEGDRYIITSKGSNLNLRETPSLEGKVVITLLEGDALTIMDGPIQFDGYSWWKVRTNQDFVGWVVDIPDWYQPTQ